MRQNTLNDVDELTPTKYVEHLDHEGDPMHIGMTADELAEFEALGLDD